MKVRTVTTYVPCTFDRSAWKSLAERAVKHNNACRANLEEAGFDVQTTRIITNPFPEWCRPKPEEFLEDVEYFTSLFPKGTRLNIGAASSTSASWIPMLPEAIARYGVSASVLVGVDGMGAADLPLALACADVIRKVADTTEGGEGNFCFCASASPSSRAPSSPPPSSPNALELAAAEEAKGGMMVGVPYFPSGFTTTALGWYCTMGLQFPDTLVDAIVAEGSACGAEATRNPATRSAAWASAASAMRAALEEGMDLAAKSIVGLCEESGIPLLGVDGSAAPLPSAASLCEVYKLLGVEEFGNPGTLECSAFLTRVLKGTKVLGGAVPLIGYTGLMLPPTEDTGLASSAAKGNYSIRDLLQYSAVCGIGLDTVPVPGNAGVEEMGALIADVVALAFRLGKPLSVRLFPVPGLKAGEITKFTNPNLCDTKVFAL